MQDIKQQLFNILESNYGHIEINAQKQLEDLLSLAVEQERKRIEREVENMFLCNLPIYKKHKSIWEIEVDIINLIKAEA